VTHGIIILGPGFRGLVRRRNKPVYNIAGVIIDKIKVTLSDIKGA
jgi:hypothetical protein